MGYSDKEIERFQHNLSQNHQGKDQVLENDFVHAMGSLSVMLYPNSYIDLMMRFGTSSNSTNTLNHFLKRDFEYIAIEFT